MLSAIWIRECSTAIAPLKKRVPGRDVSPAMRSDALTCTPSLGAAASGRQIAPGPFGVLSRPRLQEARRTSRDGPSLSYARAVGGGGTSERRDVRGIELWQHSHDDKVSK